MRPRRAWLEIAVPVGVILILIALLAPAVQQARTAARKTQSKNNLKQLGLAFANYHDTFNLFPPGATVDVDGVAYHGWTTSILPYLDASPTYNNIEMGKPWDAPENEFHYRAWYPVYRSPLIRDEVATEGYPLLHYEGNPNLLHRNSSVALSDLTAGASQTWMLGSAAGSFLPWGYPFHWRPLGDRLSAGPNSFDDALDTGSTFLFADGTVRFVAKDVAPDVLRKMAEAPPVATENEIAVAPPPATFRTTGRIREVGLIGEDSYFEAISSPNRDETKITLRGRSKDGSGQPPKADQMRLHVVQPYPHTVWLIGNIDIDEEMADVLSELKQLRTLRVHRVIPTEKTIERLRSLPRLSQLSCDSETDEERAAIEKGLTGISISRARSRIPW